MFRYDSRLEAAVKVDSCQGGSHQLVSQLRTADNGASIEQVLIDPEASAHVSVGHQVGDGSTADVGVLVNNSVVELDDGSATQCIDEQSVSSSGRTSDEFGEHVEEAKSGVSVLSQLKVETLLTLSGRVETQLSRETTGLTVAVDGGGQSEQLAQHSIRSQ